MKRMRTRHILAIFLTLLGATLPSTTTHAGPPTRCDGVALEKVGVAVPTGTVPVVFVHGITSSPAMWRAAVPTWSAPLLNHVSTIPGVATYTFDYSARSLEWVTDDTVGPRLGRAITCLARASGRKVFVVAHSMGGLATKYAAGQSDGAGAKVGDHLAGVVSLGTPYEGSLLLTAIAAPADIATSLPSGYSLVAKAILTACAFADRNSPEAQTCSIAGLPSFGIAGTPAGFALRVGSREIQSLPPWPKTLPVLALAGDEEVSVSVLLWTVAHLRVGDPAVMADSATAGGNVVPAQVQSCDVPFEILLSAAVDSECHHNNLQTNSKLADAVFNFIKRYSAEWSLTGARITRNGEDPRFRISVSFPQIRGYGPAVGTINTTVRARAQALVNQYLADYDFDFARRSCSELECIDGELTVTYEAKIKSTVVAVRFEVYEVYNYNVHGGVHAVTAVLDRRTGNAVELDSLFAKGAVSSTILRDVRNEVLRDACVQGDTDAAANLGPGGVLELAADDLTAWWPTARGISVSFGMGRVGSNACGIVDALVPWSVVRSRLSPLGRAIAGSF